MGCGNRYWRVISRVIKSEEVCLGERVWNEKIRVFLVNNNSKGIG